MRVPSPKQPPQMMAIFELLPAWRQLWFHRKPDNPATWRNL